VTVVLWTLIAYLIGAIPTSYLAARFIAGIDLREQGSGNLGATNLYRVLGLKYALPVGVFDVAKGTAAVVLCGRMAGDGAWLPYLTGAAAIVGHVFPVYLRFKGGKGVATAAGVMAGLAPIPIAVSAAFWGLLLYATGIMSLASVAGAIAFPLAVWVFAPGRPLLLVTGILIASFIIFTHRANIQRLLRGTEPRVGRRARVDERQQGA
jgi:glycerol-3-phosphate acyltransferase PlsY